MSLNITLFNALSALQTNQAAIQVTSNNVANANTEGFTRKIARQESIVIAGTGAGVRLSGIQRQVDEYLLRELRGVSGSLGGLQVQDTFFQRMQDMFGAPGSDSSISASIDRFEAALHGLAVTPEGMSERLELMTAAEALVRQFNTMSRDIQTLRLQADQEIARAIEIVNAQVKIIDELNSKISSAQALGQPTVELEDKRDIALNKIAEQLEISYFTKDNGEVAIYTRGGRALLDSDPQPLSHIPASSMTASFTYPGAVDGIHLDGTDITTEIRSGRIGALIALRDGTLPDMTAELHNLATTLRDEVNRIHNEGTGLPAATRLTSSRPQTGTAASLSGTVQITLLNPDGTQAFTATVPAPGTLDAAGFAAAIDAALAGFGGASASENGGVVTIDGAGFGVAISGGTIDPGSGAPVTNLSDFLHLNDFFVGGDGTSTDYAGVIAIRDDIAANPLLVSRGAVQQDAVTGDYYVSTGDNSVVQRLAELFSQTLSFPAAGGLSQSGTTLAGYATEILSRNAMQYDNALTQKASQQALYDEMKFRADSMSGVNVDEEMANLVVLQNAYAASARLVTVADEMYRILTSMGA